MSLITNKFLPVHYSVCHTKLLGLRHSFNGRGTLRLAELKYLKARAQGD